MSIVPVWIKSPFSVSAVCSSHDQEDLNMVLYKSCGCIMMSGRWWSSFHSEYRPAFKALFTVDVLPVDVLPLSNLCNKSTRDIATLIEPNYKKLADNIYVEPWWSQLRYKPNIYISAFDNEVVIESLCPDIYGTVALLKSNSTLNQTEQDKNLQTFLDSQQIELRKWWASGAPLAYCRNNGYK